MQRHLVTIGSLEVLNHGPNVLVFIPDIGLVYQSDFRSWHKHILVREGPILTPRAVLAVVLPSQLNYTIFVLRHCGCEPYSWKDLWFTVGILIVGVGFILAGFNSYNGILEGKELSLLDSVLLGLAVYLSMILYLGVPYAYLQFSQYGNRREREVPILL